MKTLLTRISKTCPACGGMGRTEATLPFSTQGKPEELNIDNPRYVTERLSLSSLLALIECLPFKQFVCRDCGNEFRMQTQTSKEQLHALLASMQPQNTSNPNRKRKLAPLSALARAALLAQPESASTYRQVQEKPDDLKVAPPAPKPLVAPPDQGTTKTRPDKPATKPDVASDWEPYHLEQDLASLFDQFDEGA